MVSELVGRISYLIRTQDNRATSDPLFLVQQKKRIFGMCPDYCDDYQWVDEVDPDTVADEIQNAGLDEFERRGKSTSGWIKVFYVDQWEFVTVCFTEQACEEYIEANGHNLNEPRIYVASAYRNREMIAVRNMLSAMPEVCPQ